MHKRLTKTNFKSFIKKNEGKLQIRNKYSFSGMTDGMESDDNVFRPVVKTDKHIENTFGIGGAWLVGGGRDHFSNWYGDKVHGIEVSNACGCFIVAVAT